MILKIYRYIRTNGIYLTYRRILLEFKKNKVIRLPATKQLRVLFISSDNDRSSGAFLSMVALNVILRTKYNVDTFIILPNSGNGEELLIQNKIPYTMIESKNWVIPLDQIHSLELEKDIKTAVQYNNKAILILEEFINKNHFDIVHINTTYSYIGALAAISAKIPYVWHIREFLEEDQNNTLWNREKGNVLINQATKVITISNSIHKKYQKIIDQNRLVCIQNGIDDTKFYLPNKEILNKKRVSFIFIGVFEYYKGQIEFAEACVKLRKLGYDFEVHFIGTGRQEVQDKVKLIFSQTDIVNQIHYHGYRNNVNDYLAMSDISFTCAKSEAFGRTTVEAMLAGNLVIGANTAGTQELIEDTKTGLLYEQGNSDDLCKKMVWALQHAKKAQVIAHAGQQHMYDNMTATKNAEKIYSLYQNIIKQQP